MAIALIILLIIVLSRLCHRCIQLQKWVWEVSSKGQIVVILLIKVKKEEVMHWRMNDKQIKLFSQQLLRGNQAAARRSGGSTGFSGSRSLRGWGGKAAKCSATSVEKLTWVTDLSGGAQKCRNRHWMIIKIVIATLKLHEWSTRAWQLSSMSKNHRLPVTRH